MAATRYATIHADRDWFDARLRPVAGWAQIDTWQDARFFGVWTHPATRRIVTFAEGDVTIEILPDAGAYRAALSRALAFYDIPSQPARIDVGVLHPTHPTRDALVALGLAHRLH